MKLEWTSVITTEVDLYTERIDDMPLLLHFLQQMGIQEILDEVANTHGNGSLFEVIA